MGKATVAAMACAAMLASAGIQADDLKAGPTAPAADLIAGRSSGLVLRVAYDITTSAAGAPSRITADIAPDYVFVHRTFPEKPPEVDLFDYRTRRFITIDEKNRSFVNRSLYAMVDFRYAESYNRRVIRGALNAAGIGKSAADVTNPFWDQQELGIVAADDTPVTVDRKQTAAGGVRLVVDGLNGGEFEPSPEALSPAEMQGLLRFLHENFNLHPILLTAIAGSGKLPSAISALAGRFSDRKEKIWRLASVERITVPYPLPADAKPAFVDDAAPLAESLRSLLPLMLDAVAGRYHGGPRSVADYRTQLAKALADGNILQHFVLDNEFQLQYGLGIMACINGNRHHDDCSQQQSILAIWKSNASTMALIEAFGIEGKDPKVAIAKRLSVPRNGLSDAYIIDLWNGDTMLQQGDLDGAGVELAKAIRGNPYVGGFYKDLGDVFGHSFEPMEQWLCYDLARSLPGAEEMLVVDGIAKHEKFLADKYPEFF
jgi:hypothetical protein